ncbi:MAG: hypothetical protein H0U71_00285 [Gammaproteobacteria bacterium]|nr:hypothetical protein [Gammaproteobacteria bacterium]
MKGKKNVNIEFQAHYPDPDFTPPYESTKGFLRRKEFIKNDYPGPKFTREDLIYLSHGSIYKLFGEIFKPQDQYAKQVRLPEPPLLLCGRVLGIKGEAGTLGKGTIWTETDVVTNGWYLHYDRMLPGLLLEAGQADLLLISWQGIDLINRGERVYRVLGSELTFHQMLPKPGDLLAYEINIDSHAKHADIRLFFFNFKCLVNNVPALTVHTAQAGFFTQEELNNSQGVLWNPESADYTEDVVPLAPVVKCQHRELTREQLEQFAAGNAWNCFGKGFEMAAIHTQTPNIPPGELLLINKVEIFDSQGGPAKRGYLRAIQDISPNDWFFNGHFYNDPCMPGSLMFDVGLQTMAIYMTALGMTLDKDGWRFQPILNTKYTLRCRGQVIPTSKKAVYELFIDRVIYEPRPQLWAHILTTVDGRKAFHVKMGLELVLDYPVKEAVIYAIEGTDFDSVPQHQGFKFDLKSIQHGIYGPPTKAFGKEFHILDKGERRTTFFPSPPYSFLTRIAEVTGKFGECDKDSSVIMEYHIPPNAWYFQEINPVMPFSVMMEVVLQACGWLATYMGSPLKVTKGVHIRNLDGKGILHREVTSKDKMVITKARLKKYSQVGDLIIISFYINCYTETGQEIYSLESSFGYFTLEAFARQMGIPVKETEKTVLQDISDFECDTRTQIVSGSKLQLRNDKLLMIDKITGYWPEGGEHKKGRLRAIKHVDPSLWFFKAHFFRDPVQPGSLGIEALLQLMQFYMLQKNMDEGFVSPYFEPIMLNHEHEWKYRGQVLPHQKLITIVIDIMEEGKNDKGSYVIASGSYWIDGLKVYEANLGMRISEYPFSETKEEDTIENDYPGLKLNRSQLIDLTKGNVADVLGEKFREVENYLHKISIPKGDLLLFDRVLGMDVPPNQMSKAKLWSETYIKKGEWYMFHNHMMTGPLIESGQSHILLVILMGLDFIFKGTRFYRMLGSDLTILGHLPPDNKTLFFNVEITGSLIKQENYLFFYDLQCYCEGKLLVEVKNAQFGFFTRDELKNTQGLLWNPTKISIPPATTKSEFSEATKFRKFSKEQVEAFVAGDLEQCFGPQFSLASTHRRTPTIPGGKYKYFDEILEFSPQEGIDQRGYMKVAYYPLPNEWFFDYHFPNDPCMPGSLMIEGALQCLSFYLAALGLTLDKDGWRFELIKNETFKLRTRAQVAPTTKIATYEIFVEQIYTSPRPTIIAHVWGKVDGISSSHARLGLELVPDWPLAEDDPKIVNYYNDRPAFSYQDFTYDYPSLLFFAEGKPSKALGPAYQEFDDGRRITRLPCEPFLFISRVVSVDAPPGKPIRNVQAIFEYDVVKDAWYFEGNSYLPYFALLEIALQPCIWLGSYLGSFLAPDKVILFRVLTGKAILKQPIGASTSRVSAHLVLKDFSKLGKTTIDTFEINCFDEHQNLLYQLESQVAFVPEEAFDTVKGLPVAAFEQEIMATPDTSLSSLPFIIPSDNQLRLVDAVTGFWAEGGTKSLGLIRAVRKVSPHDWYFKAHFFQDPVQPGSIGIQSIIQLMQIYYLSQQTDAVNKQFIVIPNQEHYWKCRSQILPHHKEVVFIVDIQDKNFDKDKNYIIANGSCWVDGLKIYEIKNIGITTVD